MSSGGRLAKILEKVWRSRGEVQTSSENCGLSEEGCCVEDIVHGRARLTAVVQCSGVCEATTLARRSGGRQSRQRNAADRSVVSSVVWWYCASASRVKVTSKNKQTNNKQQLALIHKQEHILQRLLNRPAAKVGANLAPDCCQ